MSHFTVGVIADKLSDVDNMLAPYQENNMGDCPREYLEWVSVTSEYREDYSKDTRTMVKLEDGSLVSVYDSRFEVTTKNEKNGVTEVTHIVPENLTKVEVPISEIYPTFEEFMEYIGYDFDEEMQDYGYWENPNAKWDWYEVGGRWNNILLVKDTVDVVEVGEPSFLNLDSAKKSAPEGYKWVNACKLKDLELDKMMEGAYNKAIRFWELIIEKAEPKNSDEEEEIKWCLYRPEYYTNRYSSKEEYAKYQSMFNTYALLDKDGWHSKGDMLWFAADTSTGDTERSFIEKFNEELKKSENQEKFLVIVDCHI